MQTGGEWSTETLTDAPISSTNALKERTSSSLSSTSQQNVYERIVLFLSTAFLETPSKDMDFPDIVSRLAETLNPQLSTLRAPVDDRLSHSFFFSQLAGILSDASINTNSGKLGDALMTHVGHYFWNLIGSEFAPYVHIHTDRTGLFGDEKAAKLLGKLIYNATFYKICNDVTVVRTALDQALSNLTEMCQSFAVYVSEDEFGAWNNLIFPKVLRKQEFELIFRKGIVSLCLSSEYFFSIQMQFRVSMDAM